MKQLDYESSNYKHKEDIKNFVNTFNELADKYVKSFENSDGDLKRVTANIAKKNTALEKLEATLLDLGNKTAELVSLKEMSNEEIKALNAKKSTISYTDSEVQKMELDDINSQITAKKGKISKIEAKIDATKAKVKTSNEEKKVGMKELQELEKSRASEEEALYRTQALIELVKELRDQMNDRALDIVNAPYKPVKEEVAEVPKLEPEVHELKPEKSVFEEITEEVLSEPIKEETEVALTKTGEVPFNIDMDLTELDFANETLASMEAKLNEDDEEDSGIVLGVDEPVVEEAQKKDEKDEESHEELNSSLASKFEKEGLNIDEFTSHAKAKMNANKDTVLKNVDILKKHNVPLEYTLDQPEIYYDINPQDLDDLLSIITTDDEGNGMGFTIDFTYNILSELAKINVDKLIDVYNDEFMNVNAKSGIIYLLKLTNPNLKDFEKNRRTNIEILRGLGASTVDEIVEKHPEFVNMDNPLFVNVLNAFDKSDLVDKLNSDVDVITKIIDYWKNN